MTPQFFRISVALLLLGTAGFSVAPYATSYVSTSAVINAPLISVNAPFDGVVKTPSKRVIYPVSLDEELFELEHSMAGNSELRSLNSQLNSVTGEIVGLRKQSRDLEELSNELKSRQSDLVHARMEWFSHVLNEAQAESKRATTVAEKATEQMNVIDNLTKRGMSPKNELIETQVRLAEAHADLQKANANVARLQVERDTVNSGKGIDLSSNDMQEINYRLDEITVRQADIDSHLLRLEARKSGLQVEIRGLRLENTQQRTYKPKATASGVIWETTPPAGSTVVAGTPIMQILDCSRRFIEVQMPERHFENILPGNTAKVQLTGSKEYFTTKVYSVYGSGARPNREMQAASPRISLNSGLRVIVGAGSVDPTDVKVARSICDVGRTAEVLFELPKTSIISRIINSFGSLTPEHLAGTNPQPEPEPDPTSDLDAIDASDDQL